jgi:hypothetical protein
MGNGAVTYPTVRLMVGGLQDSLSQERSGILPSKIPSYVIDSIIIMNLPCFIA